MNGADSLVQTLLTNGVDACFANPGTSEMHFVAALDRNRAMRCVLGLFEGVVTGAADGYYRMLERPAATLLHLGPGLGNGIANLHNAKKAQSGILNIVGEHVTTHLPLNPPLAADIEGLARPVSAWVRTASDAASIAPLAAEAIAAIAGPPPAIATLILPGDAAWGVAEGKAAAARSVASRRKRVAADVIDKAARLLRSGEPTLVILGGPALKGAALDRAGEVAGRTNCRIATQFFSARLERGAGRVPLERIPYAVDQALTMLKPFRHIITVCTDEPIAFFAYPGKPSRLKPDDCDVLALCTMQDDCAQALADLAEAVGAKDKDRPVQAPAEKRRPSGALNAENLAQALLVTMPEGCILVDESVTTGRIDRLRHAGLDRRGDCLPRSAGPLHRRRWQRNVHDPIAVDASPRRPQRHDRRLRQSQLSDPQERIQGGRRRRAGIECAQHARHRQPDARFRGAGEGHGNGRDARRDRGRSMPRDRAWHRRARPDADRSAALSASRRHATTGIAIAGRRRSRKDW
jgi:acetolactate synthase I/II/III large subunit